VFNNYFNNHYNARDDGTRNVWFINPVSGTNINSGPKIGGNWWSDFQPEPLGGLFPSSPPLDYHVSGSAGSVNQHPLPGFEVLAFISALAIALLVLKKRKRG
jgi:hypothetical protein